MSEKPTVAKLIEFDKSEEAAHESKEDVCSKKEQIRKFSPEEMENYRKSVEAAMDMNPIALIHSIPPPREFVSYPTAEDMEKLLKARAMSSMSDQTRESSRLDEIRMREAQESMAFFKLRSKPRSFIIKDSEICWLDDLEVESSTSKSEFHKVPEVGQKLHPETTSEMSTSAKAEAPEIPDVAEVCQMSKTISTSNEPEDRQVPEVYQKPRISILKKTEDPEVAEIRRTHSMPKISDKTEEPEIPEVRRTHSTATEISVPIKFYDVEDVEVDGTRATSEVSTSKSGEKKEFTEDIKDDVSKISTKLEESSLKDMRQPSSIDETRMKIMTQIIGEVSFLFKSSLSIEDVIK